jgi:hypothetical protein
MNAIRSCRGCLIKKKVKKEEGFFFFFFSGYGIDICQSPT